MEKALQHSLITSSWHHFGGCGVGQQLFFVFHQLRDHSCRPPHLFLYFSPAQMNYWLRRVDWHSTCLRSVCGFVFSRRDEKSKASRAGGFWFTVKERRHQDQVGRFALRWAPNRNRSLSQARALRADGTPVVGFCNRVLTFLFHIAIYTRILRHAWSHHFCLWIDRFSPQVQGHLWFGDLIFWCSTTSIACKNMHSVFFFLPPSWLLE
jgi:hypothetical protein